MPETYFEHLAQTKRALSLSIWNLGSMLDEENDWCGLYRLNSPRPYTKIFIDGEGFAMVDLQTGSICSPKNTNGAFSVKMGN